MSKLLVIMGSVVEDEASVSTRVAKNFVQQYEELHKDDEVSIIDVKNINDICFTTTILDNKCTPYDLKVLKNREDLLKRFLEADKIVLASPMWNFGLPGRVKEVIDTFVLAGTTFRYLEKPNEAGEVAEPLTKGKKMLFIQAMGGFNAGANDVGYLQVHKLFNFIGVKDFVYIPIQATDIPGLSEEEKATTELNELVKTF